MKTTWKQVALGLGALALSGSVTGAYAAICGDVNGNGGLSFGDCVQLLDLAAGPPDPSPVCGGQPATQCGDLNANGSIDVGDAVVCLSTVAGNVTLFAPCSGPPSTPNCPSPGSTVTVSGNITTNQRWGGGCEYLIDGTTFVNSGVTVTIDAGTVVKGKSVAATPSALVFLRGSRINAVGTSASPIVFTSDKTPGTRGKGDWGGLVLNGRGQVNVPGGEGLAEGLSNIPYGANPAVPNDNSGTVRFVRIEYAGRALTVDNELNIFTLNGVGAGTQIDHVQAHYGLDDCIEWFGGNVNGKFLVASACGDDGLDWQLGFVGKVQYAMNFQNICANDTAAGSASNGIEADNNENGFTNLPYSDPSFCNITLVGSRGQSFSLNGSACTDIGTGRGILYRRGTEGHVYNAIVSGYQDAGVRIESPETTVHLCQPGGTIQASPDLTVENSIFFNNGASGLVQATCPSCGNCVDADTMWGVLHTSLGNEPTSRTSGGTDPSITEVWPPGPGVVPGIGTVPDTHAATDCSTKDSFFDPTDYIGAFQPGQPSWLSTPWISFVIDGLS